MNVVPLAIARVPMQLQGNMLLGTMQSGQIDLMQVEQQISTGQRLNQASDDPAAAIGLMQLKRELANSTQYQTNLNFASGFLASADSSLSGVTDLVTQAKSVASSEIGAGVTADERASQATVIDSLITRAATLANTKYQNISVFGGENGTQDAFSAAGGGYKYNGSVNAQGILTPDGSSLDYTMNGNAVFGGLSSQVVGYKNLAPQLTATTRLADVAGARNMGVALGTINITDGATTVGVDLSSAATAGDVTTAINTALTNAGLTSSVSLVGGSLQLNAGALTNVSIADAGSTTAADLGIAISAAAGTTTTGESVAPRITATTRLADLRNGAGISPAGIKISNGSSSATITLAGPPVLSTVQDLVNAINSSGTNVRAEIKSDGTGLNLFNPVSGTALQIGENGGTTAEDLGLRSFQPTSQLTDFNFGGGVTPIGLTAQGPTGSIVVTRTDGTSFSVAVDKIATTSQLAAAINAAAGGTVTATVSPTDNKLTLTDTAGGAGNISVTAAPNYISNGSDLGIFRTGAGATLNGTNVTLSTDDFRITRRDGTNFTVNLMGAKSVQDVLTAINTADGNTGPNAVTASLATSGNGITLTDASVGAGTFTVAPLNASPVAAQLGIGKTSATATIAGDDVNPLEPRGLLSSLMLLRDGLATNDTAKIQRAASMLEDDGSRVIQARGTVGAREKDIQSRLSDVTTDQTQINSSMADLGSTNMTEAITKYQQLQTTYQASLKVAQTMQSLSLLNFLT